MDKYGTHYISEAKMGSYYIQQSLLSRNSYFEMVLNGIDIEVYAGFSAVGSIYPSFANQTEAETFQGYLLSVLLLIYRISSYIFPSNYFFFIYERYPCLLI